MVFMKNTHFFNACKSFTVNDLTWVLMGIVASFLMACIKDKKENFATDAPVKKIVCTTPFPTDLVYIGSPDSTIIVGTKKIEPTVFEISGYETETAKKRWQLPFVGEIVGQTQTQLLIYQETPSSMHFVNWQDGQITRTISPAPNPLRSKNGLHLGMAFTDSVYITTKSLYTSVWADKTEDKTFPIGITAKNWGKSEPLWFLPKVKQIVVLEYPPVIYGDTVLIINPQSNTSVPYTYQLVSLKTGKEWYRGAANDEYRLLGKRYFIEQNGNVISCISPTTGKVLWKIKEGNKPYSISVIGNQITIQSPSKNSRSIQIVNGETGKTLQQFTLPFFKETNQFEAIYLPADGQVWLYFEEKNPDWIKGEPYHYVVGYDVQNQKALWRTDFHSQPITSLLSLVGDKMRVE